MQCRKIKNSKKNSDTFCYELAPIPTKKNSKKIRIFFKNKYSNKYSNIAYPKLHYN
jgi:hypothetical protein